MHQQAGIAVPHIFLIPFAYVSFTYISRLAPNLLPHAGAEIYTESSTADNLHFLLHGSAVVTPPSPTTLRMQSDLASGLTVAQITAVNAAAAASGAAGPSSVARRSFSAFFSPENMEDKSSEAVSKRCACGLSSHQVTPLLLLLSLILLDPIAFPSGVCR